MKKVIWFLLAFAYPIVCEIRTSLGGYARVMIPPFAWQSRFFYGTSAYTVICA